MENTTTTTTPYFCLFSGRHPLPNNPTALFEDSPNPLQPVSGHGFDRALAAFSSGEVVRLYVTGATYALMQFVSGCMRAEVLGAQGSLVLLHYDRDTEGYTPQVVISNEQHSPRYRDGFSMVTNQPSDYWDGSLERLTPEEANTRFAFNPEQAYDVRWQIGVENGTIDPYDCE